MSELTADQYSTSAALVMDEVLSSRREFDANDVGRKLVGKYNLVADTCGADPWYERDIIAVGSSVFAAFSGHEYFLSYCSEPCARTNCVGLTGLELGVCKNRCEQECVPDRSNDTVSARLMLLSWTEPLDFGLGASVTAAEVAELTVAGTCHDRFPREDPGFSEDSAGCSLRAQGADPGKGAASLLIAVLGYAAIRRVRRQRRR